jgi:hypothetical protein
MVGGLFSTGIVRQPRIALRRQGDVTSGWNSINCHNRVNGDRVRASPRANLRAASSRRLMVLEGAAYLLREL